MRKKTKAEGPCIEVCKSLLRKYRALKDDVVQRHHVLQLAIEETNKAIAEVYEPVQDAADEVEAAILKLNRHGNLIRDTLLCQAAAICGVEKLTVHQLSDMPDLSRDTNEMIRSWDNEAWVEAVESEPELDGVALELPRPLTRERPQAERDIIAKIHALRNTLKEMQKEREVNE